MVSRLGAAGARRETAGWAVFFVDMEVEEDNKVETQGHRQGEEDPKVMERKPKILVRGVNPALLKLKEACVRLRTTLSLSLLIRATD